MIMRCLEDGSSHILLVEMYSFCKAVWKFTLRSLKIFVCSSPVNLLLKIYPKGIIRYNITHKCTLIFFLVFFCIYKCYLSEFGLLYQNILDCSLNSRHSSFSVLEAGKLKIKVYVNVVPGEDAFPCLQIAAFLLGPNLAAAAGVLLSLLFLRDTTNPFMGSHLHYFI